MKKGIEIAKNRLQMYSDKNRDIIDETMVSLRLMKEIDGFLEINDINQREFAANIDCSESFISQLMAGTKKFNTSFINKFEKKYEVKIDFKIKAKNDSDYFLNNSNTFINININVFELSELKNYSLESRTNEYSLFNSLDNKIEFNNG